MQTEHDVTEMKNYMNEETTLEVLGVTKNQLRSLRDEKELPYIQVAKGARLYYIPDVHKWLQIRARNSQN